MGLLLSTRRALLGSKSYIDKVLGYDPSVFWPLDEPAGAVATDLVHGWNGAYAGVTLGGGTAPDGGLCPFFDGATGYVDASAPAFLAAWNGNTGSLSTWAQVSGAGVWVDGTEDQIWRIWVDVNNIQYLRKPAGGNALNWRHTGGGVGNVVVQATNTLAWFHMGMTWGGGQVQAYFNGAPTGAPFAIGGWVGAPIAAFIGAISVVPAFPWNGYIARLALWMGTTLTAAQMADLATV